MASAGYIKASAPPLIIFLFIQLVLMLQFSLSSLALPLMMPPFVTSTSTTTRASNTTFTKGCIKEERDALLAFKSQIIYHNVHPISSWGHHIIDDCCHWPGVRCDNISGHVVRLNLQRTRPRQYDYYYYDDYPKCDEWDLSGKISESLIGLRYLRYLDLSFNCFTGVIPHGLGNLTRLRYLDLTADEVQSYKVDDAEWLSGLSSLRYLLMDAVSFYGVNNVMQSLNKLRHLKRVSLSGCSMNSIPESLPHLNFTSLTFMDIGHNMLYNTTSIPEWLFRIPNLRHLNMAYCWLTGTIPSSIGNATSLQFLGLSGNEGISGDMPRGFGGLCNLLSLHLDCTFAGKSLEEDFRDAFSGCIRRNLNELSFTRSSLQGPLPDWLGEFRNLTGLFLYDNSFHGSIPESLGRLSALQYLDLAYNAFNGSIPSFIGDLCNLLSLHLDRTFAGKSLEEDFRDAFSGCIRQNLNELSFTHSSLQGPLPDWLGEFRNLTSLFLYGNSFNGSIPESLGRLSALQYLDLAYNAFIGSIPSSIGDLCNLQSLNLGGAFLGKSLDEVFGDAFSGCLRRNLNELSFVGSSLQGPLPDWLGEFRNLTGLFLSDNSFSGSIPESLGRLSGLQNLDLAYNAFNGSIPESVSQLSNLVYLDLLDNNFNYSSVITEAHLANLTSLKVLWLDHLVLNISTNWIPGFQVEKISLSYCHVGPKFPLWLANQENLQHLDISNTGINDSMPDWFWNITNSMTYLDLSNNEISGRLPQHLKFQTKGDVRIFLGSNRFEGSIPYFLPNVYALDLSNNSLSGNIPSDPGNFGGIRPQLTSLILSSNNLTGSIPSSLCNLVGLVLLELSNNHLEGAIPNCWNNLTSLQYLILANNSLVGEIPNSLISSSQFLEVLHLSNNQLHGEFPSFLKKCNFMTTLALDHNNLSGKIPSWVGESMTSLMILTLKKNNFSSNLPLLSNLTSLHFLDLSHNSFVGSIPQSYGNLMGMINGSMNGGARFFSNISEVLVISIHVSTKGVDLEYGVILSAFKFIDLSANNLSGRIPKEIIHLVGLQNLDLSCNHLSGEIPSNIGLMKSLESLNLSRNELIGTIPTSLSRIDFLGSLNLSHNNLSGKIPYVSHLTSFNDPSIYAGNLNLCGAPLDKNCTSDEEPPPNSQVDDQEDDDDNDTTWFYIGLMPGFVVGFWIVWGILLFKKEWRHVYFKYMDHMNDIMYVKIMISVPKIKRWLRCL